MKTSRAPKTTIVTLGDAELSTLKNALNQALELSASDYSTLIGGPKSRGEKILTALVEAAKGGEATRSQQPRKSGKKAGR